MNQSTKPPNPDKKAPRPKIKQTPPGQSVRTCKPTPFNDRVGFTDSKSYKIVKRDFRLAPHIKSGRGSAKYAAKELQTNPDATEMLYRKLPSHDHRLTSLPKTSWCPDNTGTKFAGVLPATGTECSFRITPDMKNIEVTTYNMNKPISQWTNPPPADVIETVRYRIK